MNTFLDKILDRKKREITALRGRSFERRLSPKRPFIDSLDKRPRLAVIAEIKKASPSKGLIRKDFDPVEIATRYEKGGACAVSVLTDETFFQGHAEHLMAVRERVRLPVLRKDFILDTLQVEETAHIGADAMLLIADALDTTQLIDLYQAAGELDIDVLIELHGAAQLDKVLRVEPRVVGINNRDLFTFHTTVETTIELIKEIPPEVTVVSESGIGSAREAAALREAGVRAILVGEALLRSGDMEGLLREIGL